MVTTLAIQECCPDFKRSCAIGYIGAFPRDGSIYFGLSTKENLISVIWFCPYCSEPQSYTQKMYEEGKLDLPDSIADKCGWEKKERPISKELLRIINPGHCQLCGEEIMTTPFEHEGKTCCVICKQVECPEMFLKEGEEEK